MTTQQVIRLAINTSLVTTKLADVNTGESPTLYLGSPLAVQLGFFQGAANALTLASLSGLDAVKVEVFTSQTSTDSPLMSEIVASASFDADMTAEEWAAKTHQHVEALFSALETELNIGSVASATRWLVVSGMRTSDAAWNTLAAGPVKFVRDATPTNAVGPSQGANIIPGSAEYDGSGEYELTGLTVGKTYKWSPGDNDTDITCGADNLTAEGNFVADATTATLTGTIGEPVTASVRADVFLTAEESDARYAQFVKGAYDNGATYLYGNLVSQQGGLWLNINVAGSTGQAPPTLPTTSNSYWLLVVAPGTDGANGSNGSNGADGDDGADGDSAYVYIRYASDSSGTGFSATASGSLKYIAVKTTTSPIASPVAGDFTGLWVKYIADDPSGVGDMLLGTAQQVTGAKSFNDETLRVYNSGATQATKFKTAATAERTFTTPDRNGTAELAPSPTALTWGASVALDLAGEIWRTLTLAGNTTFTTSGKAAGKHLIVKVLGDSSERTLTFPAWKWLGEPAPATLAASATAELRIHCWGTADTDITAEWIPQGSRSSYEALSLSTDGTSILAFKADFGHHTVLATVTGDEYDTAFTRKIVLPTTNATAGDRVDVIMDFNDSPAPTIDFRNATDDGTQLLELHGQAFEQSIVASFVYTGSAWIFENWRNADGSLAGNRFSRATTAYAATLTVDFDKATVQEVTLTGDVTIETHAASRASAGIGKAVLLKLTASGATRTIGLDTDIKVAGTAVASLDDGESCFLNLTSLGTAETDTYAAFVDIT